MTTMAEAKQTARFRGRDQHRNRLMVPAVVIFAAVLEGERDRVRMRKLVGITKGPWRVAMKQVHHTVADAIWTETIDEILGSGKQIDPEVLRRIRNNPSAILAVNQGAKNAAERAWLAGRATYQAAAERAAGDFETIMEILYDQDRIHSRANREARRQILDTAARVQMMAARSSEAALLKSWLSRRDDRVRKAHVTADRRYRPGGSTGPIRLDGKFQVGSGFATEPRASTLPASQREECRCQLDWHPASVRRRQ